MKKDLLVFLFSFLLPIVGNSMCNQEKFEVCMDTTCFSNETGICLCNSDFRKNAEKMQNLSEASIEVEKIISNELSNVAGGKDINIDSRLKRVNRLLSNQDDMSMPSFDDDILGEEIMPAGSYGTNYGKTRLTSGWESCKSFVSSCVGDKKLSLKNYLQKTNQACSKFASHLEKEETEIRNALERSRSLFETTKSRKSSVDTTNTTNCDGKIEACMRKNCEGIYYLKCYKKASCDTSDFSGCEKKVKEVFEANKIKCSKELNKCGVGKTEAWKDFIEDRIDYVPDFINKLKE